MPNRATHTSHVVDKAEAFELQGPSVCRCYPSVRPSHSKSGLWLCHDRHCMQAVMNDYGSDSGEQEWTNGPTCQALLQFSGVELGRLGPLQCRSHEGQRQQQQRVRWEGPGVHGGGVARRSPSQRVQQLLGALALPRQGQPSMHLPFLQPAQSQNN